MGWASRFKYGYDRLAARRRPAPKPRGQNLFADIRRHLPHVSVEMIFDVGANVGQSARLYRRHYREACIHCFEPVTATYIELCENLKDDRQVITHPMALGASHAEADMVLQGTSDMSRLTEAVPSGLSSDRDATLERVEVTTLDRRRRGSLG